MNGRDQHEESFDDFYMRVGDHLYDELLEVDPDDWDECEQRIIEAVKGLSTYRPAIVEVAVHDVVRKAFMAGHGRQITFEGFIRKVWGKKVWQHTELEGT